MKFVVASKGLIMGGTFWGWRAKIAAPPPTGLYMPPIPWLDWSPRLQVWDIENLGPVPYAYKVYPGTATDEFGDTFTWIEFPADFPTRLVLATVFDNPAEIIFTFDGEESLPTRLFEHPFLSVDCIQGFKIRNFIPGRAARYQIVAFR